GGNPLASAVGEAALDVILGERLPERAAELGGYLLDRLHSLDAPAMQSVRGRGLLIGIEIKPEMGSARNYCEQLLAHGVLSKDTHRQVIRLAPPLIVQREEIDWLLERLSQALR